MSITLSGWNVMNKKWFRIDISIQEKLLRLKLLSKRLDDSIKIPGTNQKIGIDPIIGLIPILGDFIGVIFSTYIMYSGIKMGVSSKIVKKNGY